MVFFKILYKIKKIKYKMYLTKKQKLFVIINGYHIGLKKIWNNQYKFKRIFVI